MRKVRHGRGEFRPFPAEVAPSFAGEQQWGGMKAEIRHPLPGNKHREGETWNWELEGSRELPTETSEKLLLVLEAPGRGLVGVSKPFPCRDKPQSSLVPRLGWAGILHNMPQPGLLHLSRVTTRNQNAACSRLAET